MKDNFPFRLKLSLQPLIEFWQSLADQKSDDSATFIAMLLDEVRRNRKLVSDDVALADLEKAGTLVEKLMTAVFPMATIDRHIAAAILPFELTPFFATPAFQDLQILDALSPENNPECPISSEEMDDARTAAAYQLILERLYRGTTDLHQPMVVGSRDHDSGLQRYFQIEFDARFTRVGVKGQKPRLEPEIVKQLADNPEDLALWRKHLPPERFELTGFGLIRATDVTAQQTLSLIKNSLLDARDFTREQGVETLRGHLRTLLGKSDLEVGVMALGEAGTDELSESRVVGRSLLLSNACLPECSLQHQSTYAGAVRDGAASFVPDIDTYPETTGLEHHVRTLGFRSLAVIPLLDEERVIGILELASPNAGDLTARLNARLVDVPQLLATALKRTLEERENRIQSLIKKRYTAIHPVVEWRFREAAVAQMTAGSKGAPTRPIVFEDVYPLYGLSDIRDSSKLRAEAIREDMVQQLGLALTVVIEAASVSAQPALDELGYRLGQQIDDVRADGDAGEGSEPIRLLRKEVEPLFDKLAAIGPSVRRRIEDYRDALDPDLHMIYRRRRDFEVSITEVNDVLSSYLEDREEHAQKLTPHYFEKYRTDGVDYNIYAGAALRPDNQFDQLDLKNLRLWQLMTMAGCVWEMAELKERLPLPLDVTHLILVQSQPLAIRFRTDEKKFDVDGAYNIRYEIVKKRIDKAEIAGTGERLTQPGMIAIAYSNAAVEREYLRYIDYLRGAGYLEGETEHLDLAPLQGVHGLRALRVRVAEHAPVSDILVKVLPSSVDVSQ